MPEGAAVSVSKRRGSRRFFFVRGSARAGRFVNTTHLSHGYFFTRRVAERETVSCQ